MGGLKCDEDGYPTIESVEAMAAMEVALREDIFIPQDVAETATIMVLGNAGLHERAPGYLIAYAILAERQRCAEVARSKTSPYTMNEQWNDACDEIADAIMEPPIIPAAP